MQLDLVLTIAVIAITSLAVVSVVFAYQVGFRNGAEAVALGFTAECRGASKVLDIDRLEHGVRLDTRLLCPMPWPASTNPYFKKAAGNIGTRCAREILAAYK